MPMLQLYPYLLEKKLVTPLFPRLRDDPLPPGFNPSKKCKLHFRAQGHSLEECTPLKVGVQDLIDNKLLQFEDPSRLNIVTEFFGFLFLFGVCFLHQYPSHDSYVLRDCSRQICTQNFIQSKKEKQDNIRCIHI